MHPSGRIDSSIVFGVVVGTTPSLVYAGLLAVTTASWFNYLAPPSGLATTFFVHIFDGIFLMHYFVEAFLWRFRVPYYRDTLAPLYFSGESQPERPHPRAGIVRNPWAQVGALSMTLALGWTFGWLDAPARQFTRLVTDPMHAENHERWGRALVAENRLLDARTHLEEALRRRADNPGARAVLRQIDERLRTRSAPESNPDNR